MEITGRQHYEAGVHRLSTAKLIARKLVEHNFLDIYQGTSTTPARERQRGIRRIFKCTNNERSHMTALSLTHVRHSARRPSKAPNSIEDSASYFLTQHCTTPSPISIEHPAFRQDGE